MKLASLILIAASVVCFAAPPRYKLIDSAHPGFIHLRVADAKRSSDQFVVARHITSVSVYDSGTKEKPQTTLRIFTTQTKYASDSDKAGSESVSYRLIYPTRAAADADARKIIAEISRQNP